MFNQIHNTPTPCIISNNCWLPYHMVMYFKNSNMRCTYNVYCHITKYIPLQVPWKEKRSSFITLRRQWGLPNLLVIIFQRRECTEFSLNMKINHICAIAINCMTWDAIDIPCFVGNSITRNIIPVPKIREKTRKWMEHTYICLDKG